MSSRHLRKVLGDQSLPPPDDSEEEGYEPPCVQAPTTSRYAGLDIASASEHESNNEDADEAEDSGGNEAAALPPPRPKRRNNRRNRKAQRAAARQAAVEDEVDRSVREVNELLGEAEPAPAGKPVPADKPAPAKPSPFLRHEDAMIILSKHLNAINEQTRMFGHDVVNGGENRRRGRQPVVARHLKKCTIVPLEKYLGRFKKVGLSMSLNRREEGLDYFTFDHSADYQRRHRHYLATRPGSPEGLDLQLLQTHMIQSMEHYHVEVMVECANAMFNIENYSEAQTLLEQSIAYMQYVSHPSFDLTDPNVRLEYKYVENRPFFIAILKYLHMLTNKACHRTALELAKLLLNLDPEDPVAVLLFIDVLALRAREHEWFVTAVQRWTIERSARFLFNIKFSYALCQYHLALKHKTDLGLASNLLEEALVHYPAVLMQIMDCANHKPDERLRQHEFFTTFATSTSNQILKDLYRMYATFTWPKWREPGVMEWVETVALGVLHSYDTLQSMRDRAHTATNIRMTIFKAFPIQAMRHLIIIKPMESLICEDAIPSVESPMATDPKPSPDTINRYKYPEPAGPRVPHANSGIPLMQFFWSMNPTINLPTLPERFQPFPPPE
ncbi:hypothetical protein JYU34_000761 [Plutella xylostella]|uniref:Transcription factor 25 n=3 Tax=Plutella xylostella TaxID=51655 RepID=A0ABQ7R8M9_PLUXY|nr:hypothetical protein JYU34_000761 [Plutella xylostella]